MIRERNILDVNSTHDATRQRLCVVMNFIKSHVVKQGEAGTLKQSIESYVELISENYYYK